MRIDRRSMYGRISTSREPRFAELDRLINDERSISESAQPRAQYARLGRPPGLTDREARRQRLEAIAAQMRARYAPGNQG